MKTKQKTHHLEPQQQAALSILEQPGQALDAQTRAILEPRFNHSFGDVRVHHDMHATRALESKAFAVGQDIVLGDVDTATPQGFEILTHELAHTVQQRGVQPDKRQPKLAPNDPSLEEGARAATRSVLAGQTASVTQTDTAQVSRWDDSETNLAVSLGLTAGGMLLPGMGGVLASAAGGADAVRQGPAANDPMADMKNVEMGLGFGNAVFGAAAGLGGASMLGTGGMASMGAGAALTGGGLTGVAALGPASAVLGAGLAGAGVGHYLAENTSVGGHSVDTVGGVDRFLTNHLLGEGSRSMTLQLDEMRSDEWDKTTANPLTWGHGVLSAGALVDEAAIGTVGALGGLAGGLVDVGSAAATGVSSTASGAYNWLDRGVRGIYGM